MGIFTKIKDLFTVSKYDIEKDKEMELKDKIFAITNATNFKISKIDTKTKQKIEKLQNAKTTKLDKLNRKLTRIRMNKFNEAKYICEDSCILDSIEVDKGEENKTRIEKVELKNQESNKETKSKTKFKK